MVCFILLLEWFNLKGEIVDGEQDGNKPVHKCKREVVEAGLQGRVRLVVSARSITDSDIRCKSGGALCVAFAARFIYRRPGSRETLFASLIARLQSLTF